MMKKVILAMFNHFQFFYISVFLINISFYWYVFFVGKIKFIDGGIKDAKKRRH